MGFFDRFGAGGGKLSIQITSARVQAGAPLSGKIVFTGGKRSQKITAIKATVHCNATVERHGANGVESSTESKAIVPQTAVSGPVTTQPEQPLEFPFSFQLPTGLQSTTPGLVEYRVSASADIDGEIDPGATAEFHVDGVPAGSKPGAMMPGAVMPGVTPGMMPGALMPGAVMSAPIGVGSAVLAQWQDGNWHPARVVATNNGMFGVDWDNPALGQSTWVGAHQLQPAQSMGAMPGMNVPMMASVGAPIAPAPIGVGSRVMAQWQDGNWHPARVVAANNGMFGVDWDNPALGQSTWVGAHQLMAG